MPGDTWPQLAQAPRQKRLAGEVIERLFVVRVMEQMADVLEERGSVRAWERGSVGAWERGSVGAWERGSVRAWARQSVGAWLRRFNAFTLQRFNAHTLLNFINPVR